MNILIVCLFIACLFPYLAKLPVAVAMKKQAGGYDNEYPRMQQAALTGFGARAVSAHQNSFEALAIFSAAILTALATQHTNATMQGLAIFYLVTRVIYYVFYFMNWATLRSAIWSIGFITAMTMIALCLS